MLLAGDAQTLGEIVAVLASYGRVLTQYSRTLRHIAEEQFLTAFTPLRYLNGERQVRSVLDSWAQKRPNFEYAEYCANTMFWHGAPGLDAYLHSPAFALLASRAIRARFRHNPVALLAYRFFPTYFEQLVRRSCLYSILGQFWRVMSRIFTTLGDRYQRGQITAIRDLVDHIAVGIAEAANRPLTYSLTFEGRKHQIIPVGAGLRWAGDAAVPYVEVVFFKAAPPKGVFTYDASAEAIPAQREHFRYGALYADMTRLGAAGVAPTLLMRDLYRSMEPAERARFGELAHDEDALLVRIGRTFQKSMFCVTNAAVLALAPDPTIADGPERRRIHFAGWAARIATTRHLEYEPCHCHCDHSVL